MEGLERDELIRVFRTTGSVRKTSEITGWSRPTVRSIVVGLGLRPLQRRYSVNPDIFRFDSTESAYWLGFILADGSISRRGPGGYPKRLTITLQRRDRDHLLKFKNFLSYSGPIKDTVRVDKRNGHISLQSTITVCSSHLCKQLLDAKWDSFKKEGDSSILEAVSEANTIHLMRGLLDGDGGFIVDRSSQSFVYFVSAHEQIALWYQHKMIRQFGFKVTKLFRSREKIFRVQYRGNIQVNRFLKSLYSSGVSLNRKAEAVVALRP